MAQAAWVVSMQALVNSSCPNVLVIHNYAHKLILVLAQATNNFPATKLVFAFHTFFSHSCQGSSSCTPAGGVLLWGGTLKAAGFNKIAMALKQKLEVSDSLFLLSYLQSIFGLMEPLCRVRW